MSSGYDLQFYHQLQPHLLLVRFTRKSWDWSVSSWYWLNWSWRNWSWRNWSWRNWSHLFILPIKILAVCIRTSTEIEWMNINGQTIKFTRYADDVSNILVMYLMYRFFFYTTECNSVRVTVQCSDVIIYRVFNCIDVLYVCRYMSISGFKY